MVGRGRRSAAPDLVDLSYGGPPEACKVGAVVRRWLDCVDVVVGKEWAQLGGSGSGCWWSLLW